jgi:hypothetical protein
MRIFWWAFIGVLAFPPLARAQSPTATLGGTVLDETGAAVPDMHIAVASLGNGLQWATTAGSQRSFVVSLLPGHYRVTARRNGFTPAEITEVVLNVGDDLTVKLLLRART